MSFGQTYICATTDYNTFERHVPAYCFRRELTVDAETTATLRVAVCGVYELYLNGRRLTRGLLSPYLSNPEDLVYFDEYEVSLGAGKNAVGLILGNGFVNNPGGYIWDFDKAPFRAAPKMSLELCVGGEVLLTGDTSFKVAPSPVLWDDYRFGECYDARREAALRGWMLPGFDDADWASALPADAPTGELRAADVAPITVEREIAPVAIFPCGDAYIYDFGENNAGVCRLTVTGRAGQTIELRHAEALKDGDIRLDNVWFVRDFWERDKEIVHLDTYVCRGGEAESYTPAFTYHGFRYVRVDGITAEQATPDLLTYLVMHTELHDRGGFTCSDPVANRIQAITRQSILSNFHHYPTDCPHREKNGWTADAALSCEAALINFDPERNYREWLRNICKARDERGSLPGIIPTSGWGFAWGNGPAWDCVLAHLPYYTYLWRGETHMVEESAAAFMAYLRYVRTRADEQGLIHIGLGDWCHTEVKRPQAPLAVTDTIMSMDTASKMAVLLEAVGMTAEAAYARGEASLYREAIRAHLVDFDTMLVAGECQTSQAMALYYGVFEDSEREAAFDRLLRLIADCDDRMDLGVLGGRVIFHVLSEYGHADLAWRMIVEQGHPSYGDLARRGATTLWESFYPEGAHWGPPSLNHHFWGDVSAWFIKAVAGIRLSPAGGALTCEIKPAFIRALSHAEGYQVTPVGRITSSWKRDGEAILLTVELPDDMAGDIVLPDGYAFADGESCKPAISGTYILRRDA